MKRKAPTSINLSWPAILSDFSTVTVEASSSTSDFDKTEKSNGAAGNYTRGKLKVFYQGETADHRLFTPDFSSKMKESLPYTPVVGFYDEDKEDFVGHATEQQIYGIVDPMVEPTFEEMDDGKKWLVCDVVLYTERPDRVGDIAKKIIGHKQSLEMDPSTIKYRINYDERKHFKNIEFTAGHFVGVSILGTEEKPAFTGSEFFKDNSNVQAFKEHMDALVQYCCNAAAQQKNSSTNKKGDEHMNNTPSNFIELSWGDKATKISDAVSNEYASEYATYLVDCYEQHAIFRFYSYLNGSSKLYRIDYSFDGENNMVTLGTITEVCITYTPIESSPDGVFAQTETDTTDKEEEEEKEEEKEVSSDLSDMEKEEEDKEESEKDSKELEDKDDDDDDKEKKEDDNNSFTQAEEDVANAETQEPITKDDSEVLAEPQEPKVEFEEGAENANVITTDGIDSGTLNNDDDDNTSPKSQDETSTSTFTDSEREEFESLKKEKKLNLIKNYAQYLSKEEQEQFVQDVNNLTYDELEFKLLKSFKANVDKTSTKHDNKNEETDIYGAMFSTYSSFQNKENKYNATEDFIRNNL